MSARRVRETRGVSLAPIMMLHVVGFVRAAACRAGVSRRSVAATQAVLAPSSNDAESVKTAAVIGVGQMGRGIAQVAAQVAGLQVYLVDTSDARLSDAVRFIDSLLGKAVEKGKATAEERAATMSRLKTVNGIGALPKQIDIAIEAATENMDLKAKIFNALDEHLAPGAILASNTSSISITKIASSTRRPQDVIGMHFMNPVPVMKLVEIIPGIATAPKVLSTTVALAERMGKTTAVARDMPGFIANRILLPYINEAFYALMESIGTPDAIDTTMKLGTNVPMGPLTLADFIGLDTCLAIMEVLHTQLGDSKYRPCPLLRQYVEAGWHGVKSKRGVYEYADIKGTKKTA